MLTVADLFTALGAKTQAPAIILTNATQDSRLIERGGLFVALRGENQDGHAFVADAVSRGATAVLVERPPEGVPGLTVVDLRPDYVANQPEVEPPVAIVVPNALTALQRLAAHWRQQSAAEVVGVTGSVGKTTTKEMIASVLSRRFRVLRSERNLNNEIGLPLTLLQLDASHQKAVLEMGMYDLGEIRLLCEIARPTIGVVTNVGPTHLERLGSIERIAQAKRELVECLPTDGWAVLNGDDPLVSAMASDTQARTFRYGLEPDFDLWADEIESHGLEGIRLRLHHGTDTLYLTVPLLGEHSAHTVMAASAVGLISGLTWDEISAGLRAVPEQLRLVVVPGTAGSTVIDDTYNSSPASALAALNLLAELDGRRVAVLGDMLELGPYEDEGHRIVGRRAAAVVSVLVTIGERGQIISDEALAYGMDPAQVAHVTCNSEAVAALSSRLRSGDFVLVKGSRGMHMEDIVHGIRS